MFPPGRSMLAPADAYTSLCDAAIRKAPRWPLIIMSRKTLHLCSLLEKFDPVP
jgi:hypothetical protein